MCFMWRAVFLIKHYFLNGDETVRKDIGNGNGYQNLKASEFIGSKPCIPLCEAHSTCRLLLVRSVSMLQSSHGASSGLWRYFLARPMLTPNTNYHGSFFCFPKSAGYWMVIRHVDVGGLQPLKP